MPKRTIAVVDGNSLIHRAFHALPPSMTAPDGRPTNAAFGFVSMLVKMVTELDPDGVIVAFDRGKPAFRIEALAQYKVHRPPTADELKVQFPIVKQLLEALAVPIVEVEGWEGDDVLGTLAARGQAAGMRVLLVTGDRDAFQLVNEDVCVVTTKKGITDITTYGPAEVLERYGVTPAQVPDYLGLKGDASDNIPGVAGIGEKTAARLLQEYGTLEEVLAHSGEIPGKLGENLQEHADVALASRRVATISRDVPIEIELSDLVFGEFDLHAVAAAFGEYRFTSLLDRVLALQERHRTARGAAGEAGVDEPSLPAGGAPGAAGALASEVGTRQIITGEAALERVRTWATSEKGWFGVAVDDGSGEALFALRRELAVCGPDAIALVPPDSVDEALALLLSGGRVASGDVKALLQEICPPDEARPCNAAALDVDSDRIFDVGVAVYLLESGRSSYELPGLAADYLGRPLGAPSQDSPPAAISAAAVADLASCLQARLDSDGSADVMGSIEMPLVPVLARMERVGVGLDIGVLAALSAEASVGIQELRSRVFELADCEFTIDSPKQLADVLFDKLGLPPQRRTKTGFSTDASVLATLAPLHPIASVIADYRELAKLKSTYLEALPRMLGDDGRLHTSFNQTVAATGRLSSSNPNLQNIPVRTELGRRIRAAFVPADADDLMVTADYSQIELRILAHLSGDIGLIEAFTSGMDFHMATAARVFGVEPEKVDSGLRARAKAVNFGIVYGQSAHGLADTLRIARAEAQAMIDRYYSAYPRVRAFLDETVAAAHRDGSASTLFGRKRRIPELASQNYNLRAFGERTAMNHPMQGTAADIMKLAMIEVDRRLREEGLRGRMVLQVHDELVFESPASEVAQLSTLAIDVMSSAADLAVPLDVTVGSGPDWASAK